MSESPNEAVPSVRSRHPRSAAKQLQFDSANDWIASNTLVASTCPISTITEIVTNDTSVGKTILSKYDTAKLQGLHGMMGAVERKDFVEDLREDVCLRQERAQEWRRVLAMLAIERNISEGKAEEAWEPLEKACKHALENTEQMQDRLVWCEHNFESDGLTPVAVAKRRVWDEAAESGSLREKRGRPISRD